MSLNNKNIKNIGASPDASCEKRGYTQTHLWQSKYSSSYIKSDKELYNVLTYIQNNRLKHELPENDELIAVINSFLTPLDKAYEANTEKGGFDAVIGNPPYIRIQGLQEFQPMAVPYLKSKYVSASKGNIDIYLIFLEKALSLINKKGETGYILPHKFFNAKYGEPIRKIISDGKHLNSIVHFGSEQIFSGATTYTCLLFLSKLEQSSFSLYKIDELLSWKHKNNRNFGDIDSLFATKNEWNFVIGTGSNLFYKLTESYTKLGSFANIFVGLQTSADNVFILEKIEDKNDKLLLKSDFLNSTVLLEKDLLRPIVSGTDVKQYKELPTRQYILYPYKIIDGQANIISIKDIELNCPNIFEYLQNCKERLQQREKGKLKNGNWHGYIYLKNMAKQSLVKLCIPRLVENLYASIDHSGKHYLDNVDVGGIIINDNYSKHDLKYLLGLLNSKILKWYFPFVSAPFRGGWLSANRQFLSQLPISTIDFSNNDEVAKHDKMVELVERMLELNKKVRSEGISTQEKKILEKQIEITDRNIDRLVYELYDLTEDEIKIVEGE